MLRKLKLNGSMKTYKTSTTNTQKRCPFHYRGLECKSRKSRNTWSKRQIWTWSTEWSRAKANRVLPRECIGQAKYPPPTTQERTLHMDITRWSITKLDWLYSLQQKMERLWADSGLDNEPLIAKCIPKLKKEGKTTGPFRYDLNQIPYDYTLEARNRFKVLDLIDSWVQFSSLTQSCPTLCNPMNCSTPGLPVHHQLPEFAQTHAHRVDDTIQLSHPLLSPSPPAPNPSQHQGLFQWVNSSHEVVKVLEFQLQCKSFQWTPRTDLF